MPLVSIHNRKGFFSDYWLGTLAAARSATGARMTAAQARQAMARLRRAMEAVDGTEPPELSHLRERLARPLFEEVLGFKLEENSDEPRLRPLIANHAQVPLTAALVWLQPDSDGVDAPQVRHRLETALLDERADYGFILSPESLRLIRSPGLGHRGASFEVSLAALVETDDLESLSAAYRVLAAENFVPGPGSHRPIDLLEAESRRHSARVSEDLKEAVFDAAEKLVGGFLQDVRGRPQSFTPDPSLSELRDAGFLALYRLLFILYAEARDERLIRHRFYQRSYSIDGIVTKLLRTPIERHAANRYGLWAHLQALFRIFNEGIEPHLPDLENIPPRGGRLFSEDTQEGRLLRNLKLDDRAAAGVLLSLATTRPRRGVGPERVSFRELDIEQLGAVYEGLLEFEPAEARETLIECRIGGRELALAPETLLRMTRLKSLALKGLPEIVAGTAAAKLCTGEAEEAKDESAGAEDVEIAEDDEEGTAEETEAAISKGATAQLVRRLEPGTFFFKPGSARKASGSYYTPTAMVNDLVYSALEPLVRERSAADIERLRVIDIACGSAHFLVGAARFLGQRLFETYSREGGGEPPAAFHLDGAPGAQVRARWEAEGLAWCKRRIVEHCLFGVDLNPAAVQLAQVALWIESLAGDRPLSFFAHHIRQGNSLLGSWLERFDNSPDPQLARRADSKTLGLFEAELRMRLEKALRERRLIDAPLPPEVRVDTPEEYRYKEDRLRRAEDATREARLLLDLRSACPLLPAIWRELPALMSAPQIEDLASRQPWWSEFGALRQRERFFHWELEFPEVFLDTKRPGFDVVLGNPPWDKVLPTKQEFFAAFDPLISLFKGNELDRRIRELTAGKPTLAEGFKAYRERATTIARVLRGSGDFPLAEARSQAAHEDLSKYFVDRSIRLVAQGGAVGLVVPSVFYNGDGWIGIRRYLLEQASIERFYGFENRQKIFPIHSSYKFVNLVARKDGQAAGSFTAAFMRHDVAELDSIEPKPWEVRITRDEIESLSPDTLAFLEYRSPRDQEIVRKMSAGRPTLGGDGPGAWGTRLISWRAHEGIFNSAEDKDLFTDPTGKLWSPTSVLGSESADMDETIARMRARGFWPVYEGKHIDQFLYGVKPIRWWLSVEQANRKYGREPREQATLVFRETASNTNERTCIATVLPGSSAGAHTLTAMTVDAVDADRAAVVLNSFCFDYALRLRTAGTHVSFTYIQPMPVPAAPDAARLPILSSRAAWQAGINHVSQDRTLWPQLWAANKAVAEAYGLSAADLRHILDSFPGQARKRPEFHAFLNAQIDQMRE